MSAVNSTSFICQESFLPDNTTSCLRFDTPKRCEKHGLANNLTFLCVASNTISIGPYGPKPLPTTFNTTVYECTLDSCPNEAPAKNDTGKGGKKGGSTGSSSGADVAATLADKKLTYSGLLVLGLIASQMLLL
ncbi:hypothetical protein BGX28_005770 [Mortierella sp. GBA30]|nr:hypothetical protein BGX28_005770 [Mortierella sp. GBA30]